MQNFLYFKESHSIDFKSYRSLEAHTLDSGINVAQWSQSNLVQRVLKDGKNTEFSELVILLHT